MQSLSIVPVADCRIKARLVKDLGAQSRLRKAWQDKTPNARPHNCIGDFFYPMILIEILETDKDQSKKCPRVGDRIDVTGKVFNVGEFFLSTNADECFEVQYLIPAVP